MRSNTEKKPIYKTYTNWSKDYKSDNFCYLKVGRAIAKWRAIEKSPILLSQYWNNEWLDGTIIILYFGGSNNIFANCTSNSPAVSMDIHITILSNLNIYINTLLKTLYDD